MAAKKVVKRKAKTVRQRDVERVAKREKLPALAVPHKTIKVTTTTRVDASTVEAKLLTLLGERCGESGENEGAVETLERIIRERDQLEGVALVVHERSDEEQPLEAMADLGNRLKARIDVELQEFCDHEVPEGERKCTKCGADLGDNPDAAIVKELQAEAEKLTPEEMLKRVQARSGAGVKPAKDSDTTALDVDALLDRVAPDTVKPEESFPTAEVSAGDLKRAKEQIDAATATVDKRPDWLKLSNENWRTSMEVGGLQQRVADFERTMRVIEKALDAGRA